MSYSLGFPPLGRLVAAVVRLVVWLVIKIASGFNLYGSEGPSPQKDGRWPHDMWEQIAMEHADQDHRNRRSNYASLSPAPVHLHGTELDRAKQFVNYRKFVLATVEAIRRCVMRVTNNRGGVPLAVRDLPGQFEAQWGTTFDQDSLGLRDMQDLIDFLDLLPGSFVLDKTTAPTNPTVKCRPVGHGIQLMDERIVRTLWMRSHEIKPKRLAGCIELYRQTKEAAWEAAREVWSQVVAKRREARRRAQRELARRQGGEALQGSSSRRGIIGESRGVSRLGSPDKRPKHQEADAAATAVAQHTAHQSGCGCPACAAERAAQAYYFLIPPTYPKEVKCRKRRGVTPRGSIAMVLRKIPKTSAPSSLPPSQDLFKRAEALIAQEVGTPRGPDTSADPRPSGVYQGPQSLALIPGAPALPIEGYPPPPLPPISV